MTATHDDATFMGLALRLAREGTGATYPNPCVGAVVQQRGRIVGAAGSAATGGPHAEIKALRAAGEQARGATVYVTLEPCSHHGRTPPCTDALIAAGVAEVVFGIQDPAEHARGRAAAILEGAGIRVRTGVLADHCARAHEHYLHHEQTRRPFVTVKSACSLDGQIGCASGDSRWITGKEARTRGHRLRAEHHAILIGLGTLLTDDPSLTVRLCAGVDPIPLVLDSRLRALDPARPRPALLKPGTIVLHTNAAPATSIAALADTGAVGIEVAADADGHVDFAAALDALGARSIRSILVEGGAHIYASLFRAALWNRWYLFHAPLLLGAGTPLLPGVQWSRVAQAPRVKVRERETVGQDTLVVFEPLGRALEAVEDEAT
ncbi:MAG: bifunctional diaminohydroxyphosphoribosylaminopyrimidine deaminase/5-amino-6-(5-phosphoribosylamino)uracil reductase RibD [Nannocystaceae bacterium]